MLQTRLDGDLEVDREQRSEERQTEQRDYKILVWYWGDGEMRARPLSLDRFLFHLRLDFRIILGFRLNLNPRYNFVLSIYA
jgi:hypothetical protein